ncbi:retrovirus-related pol polyprotein from transposon 297 [Plakobranchus ocellatus]|uniref:Flavin-containing monooxygenase n=1 Tax=Plakobranchus ocellatus TaxID=259542 RepID=A0AAV4BRX8_9GAST|nr:retrovirus-related pol polyprotein from transposon 297 [Plakobranchus ocellatus]
MPGRVAVVGGGSSGIAGTKVLADAGFTDIVCFERRNVVGGLWYFMEKPATWADESCVNRSTVINTSKEFMAFSDYPMPEHYPNFCHNHMVEEYFLDYTKHFGVEKYIRFNSEVLLVKKHSTFDSTGRWEIKWLDHKTGQENTEVFDFVLIANGHHGAPNLPKFPGLENFKGKTMHSKEFKDATAYIGKRCGVVGIGNSGGDITSELSKYCQVFLSTRRGVWVMNRLAPNGLPWDYFFHNRFFWWLSNLIPEKIRGNNVKSSPLDHELYRLKSLTGPDSTHPTVNDELPNRIACGMVKVKPNIRQFTETGVVFEDGTMEDNIDLVVFATGYNIGYSFMEKGLLGDTSDNRLKLYKRMWIPDLPHQTLAFLGAIQPLGAIFPISELQARLAAQVFKGEVRLPSPKQMKQDLAKHDAKVRKRYVPTQRHTFQVDWLPFMDELASLAGCKPNLAWVLLTDPVLFLSLAFGPGTPYQYRLYGPNSWPGARNAQLTVMDRIQKPFQTRPLPKADHGNNRSWLPTIGAVTLLASVAFYGVQYAQARDIKIWDWDLLQTISFKK